MKTSAIVLALTTALSGSLAAHAQTGTHPYHVHHSYRSHEGARHRVARSAVKHPAPAAERPGQTVENAPPSALNQIFKPYVQPGEGDNDGMSRDPDDCMKGCIGGNPQ